MTRGSDNMKCPECERTGQRSKFYMPTSYFSTAMGGSQTYYDEDGNKHYHEVNSSGGRAHCSEGHALDVSASTKCAAPGCDYGHPQTITLVPPRPAEPELSYMMLTNKTFTIPREPGGSA